MPQKHFGFKVREGIRFTLRIWLVWAPYLGVTPHPFNFMGQIFAEKKYRLGGHPPLSLRSRKEQSTRRNTEQIFISNNVDASSRTKIINLEFPSTNIYYKVILRIIQRLSATISKSEFKITFYCLNSKIILDVNFEDNTKVS